MGAAFSLVAAARPPLRPKESAPPIDFALGSMACTDQSFKAPPPPTAPPPPPTAPPPPPTAPPPPSTSPPPPPIAPPTAPPPPSTAPPTAPPPPTALKPPPPIIVPPSTPHPTTAAPPPPTASPPPPTAPTPPLTAPTPPLASKPWTIPGFNNKTHQMSTSPAPAPSGYPDSPAAPFPVKLMLFSAAAIPAMMGSVPFVLYMKTRNIELVVKLFRTPTLYIGLLNCIIWLFYSQILRRIDIHADELVISNCLNLAFNYAFLMIIYGFRRSIFKGILLMIIVVPSIIYLFVTLRWEMSLRDSWSPYLSILGFITIAVCHVSQIKDITTSAGEIVEALITAANILPNLALNACICYWCWQISPDQHFVLWLQSFMNSLCGMLELLLLIWTSIQGPPAVGAIDDGNDDDGHRRDNAPLLGQRERESGSSSMISPHARTYSGTSVATTCSTESVPPGMRMVSTLPPEIVSTEKSIGTSHTDLIKTSSFAEEADFVDAPVVWPTNRESSHLDDAQMSKTSKAFQMRQEGWPRSRGRAHPQPGANSVPVVSLTKCLPHRRRGKGGPIEIL